MDELLGPFESIANLVKYAYGPEFITLMPSLKLEAITQITRRDNE